jgi:hypothetical protein
LLFTGLLLIAHAIGLLIRRLLASVGFLIIPLMADQALHTIQQLLDFAWLKARLEASDIHALLADFTALEPLSKPHTLVRDALHLSAHVLADRDNTFTGYR